MITKQQQLKRRLQQLARRAFVTGVGDTEPIRLRKKYMDFDFTPHVEWGLAQLAEGKGFSPNDPLEDVTIPGMHALIETLGLQVPKQRAIMEDDHYVDQMIVSFGGEQVSVFNRVER